MKTSEVIFDLTKTDWTYKGVLFAEMDNAEVDKEMNSPFPTPKDYVAGVMAIIAIDPDGVWHLTARVKFPSGNKQVIRKAFDEEHKNQCNINETYILQYFYRMPLKNKLWTANPDGTADGILKILEKTDMIESIRYENAAS